MRVHVVIEKWLLVPSVGQTWLVLHLVRCTAGGGVWLHRSLERYWSQPPLYVTGSYCVSTAQASSSVQRRPVARDSDCVRISQYRTIDAEKRRGGGGAILLIFFPCSV